MSTPTLPLVVDMTVSESTVRYDMTASESTMRYSMGIDSALIVRPIPSNYGLITWNGSYLMVS